MLKFGRFVVLLSTLAALCAAQDSATQGVSPAIKAVSPKSDSAKVIESASDPAAIEVLENYVTAVGGHEVWDSVKAEQAETEIEMFGTKMHTTTILEPTSRRTYTKVETSRGTIEMGFDGQRVWQKSPALHGYMADNDPQAQALKNPPPQLRNFRTSKELYSRLPDETIEGKKYEVIRTSRQILGQDVAIKCYFDPVTHLASRISIGNVGLAVMNFSDYRVVEGRLIPFLITQSSSIGGKFEIRVVSYKVNPDYDPAIFEFDAANARPKDADDSTKTQASSGLLTKKSADVTPLIKPYKDQDIIPEPVRLDTFELVWGKVNDSYWDTTFGGLDWKAIHEQYLPKARETTISRNFHNVLNEMLGQLKSSHFTVVPPSSVARLNITAKEIATGILGVSLRWIDNQLLVTFVRKNFPAERAGIRMGYAITRINRKTPEEMLSDYRAEHPGFELRPELLYRAAAYSELEGHPGDNVALDVLDDKDKTVHLDLVLKPVGLEEDFEARRLNGNIAYIRFAAFFGIVEEQVRRAVIEMRNTDGLILDLRGNPGGLIELATNIAGLLCSTPGSLGTLLFRYEKQDYAFKGSGDAAYKGRIVILVDEASISASEIVAGGLQDLGRVTVIGSRTAGAVLASTESFLPTGGYLQYVISDFQTSKGTRLEGKGVLPQIEARPTRQALLAGHDNALDAATEYLKKKQ